MQALFAIELALYDNASEILERLKVAGYGIREIAKDQQMTVPDIKALLESARGAVTVVCGG